MEGSGVEPAPSLALPRSILRNCSLFSSGMWEGGGGNALGLPFVEPQKGLEGLFGDVCKDASRICRQNLWRGANSATAFHIFDGDFYSNVVILSTILARKTS